MTKKEIFNLCAYTRNGCILRENVFKKKFPEVYLELQNIKFPNDFIFVQKLYHYLIDDLEFKQGYCLKCGKRSNFIALRSGYHQYCCNDCQRHSDIVKQKREQTIFKRFGVTNAYASEKIKEKLRNINLERRGVEYPGESEEVKEKIKQTKLKRYNDAYYTNREQSRQTYLKHRAERGETWLKEIQEKTKKTNRKKYGKDYPTQTKYIRNKITNTNLKRYGVKNYIELSEVRLKSRENQKTNNGKSYLEKSILDYIKSIYKNTIIRNDRFILNGKEIDILLPDINIGFEINGDFWHMNPNMYNECDINPKRRETAKQTWEYDNLKIELAKTKNVSLFIIWENDWKYNNAYTKTKIKNIIDYHGKHLHNNSKNN